MKRLLRSQTFRALALAGSIALVAAPAAAEQAYGVSTQNRLIGFDTTLPGVLTSNAQITGLGSGEVVVGIDFRPLAGGYQLFALGSQNNLYRIDNPSNGIATLVNGGPAFALNGVEFGFDFNPTVDRIRVVSNEDQNLRLRPDNGGLAAGDPALVYQTGDQFEASNPNIVGSAYTNNVPGATSTTLYGIDSNLNTLVRQLPNPSQGNLIHLLSTTGPLGFDTTHEVGFDISPTSGIAFASLTFPGDSRSQLMTINLATGAATDIGPIGGTDPLRGLALIPEPASLSLLALAVALATRRR